jgi:CheY-like chemotaxis protein
MTHEEDAGGRGRAHASRGIATAFRDRGWEVVEAADGAEAFARLEEAVFDVS